MSTRAARAQRDEYRTSGGWRSGNKDAEAWQEQDRLYRQWRAFGCEGDLMMPPGVETSRAIAEIATNRIISAVCDRDRLTCRWCLSQRASLRVVRIQGTPARTPSPVSLYLSCWDCVPLHQNLAAPAPEQLPDRVKRPYRYWDRRPSVRRMEARRIERSHDNRLDNERKQYLNLLAQRFQDSDRRDLEYLYGMCQDVVVTINGRVVCVSPSYTVDELLAITKRRAPISQSLRAKVAKRDRGRCRYCRDEQGPFEIDHVTPVAWGGATTMPNLVLSCHDCSRRKGSEKWRPLPIT